jgi:2-desacetyl-2-hydroxyethyl bacteriochlorophyllide A dehydrogenase
VTLALWFVGPGQVQLGEHDLAAPGPSEVLAHGLFSAVSHGTEGLLVSGHAPLQFDPSLDEPGASTYPRRYGYAWVGEVKYGALPPGTRVFALATHAQAHVLPVSALRVLPKQLPAPRATLAASMETALTAVWDAELNVGARVLVLGAGSIGTLVAHVAQRAGAEVMLVERDLARRERARAVGVEQVQEESASLAPEYDVVFECTGNPALLDTAVASCCAEGRVVIVSFYGTKAAPIALGERFHRQRLRIISTQVSKIPPPLAARYDHARRFEVVLGLLRDARLDALVEERTPFEDAPRVYRDLQDGKRSSQILFDYSKPGGV